MLQTIGELFVFECDHCGGSLGTNASPPDYAAALALAELMHWDVFMGRAACLECVYARGKGAKMDLKLDLIPKRFLELHAIEFLAWGTDRPGPRSFVLHWPALGYEDEPRTLDLDRRVIMDEDGRASLIEVFIPKDEDILLMSRYLSAIRRADAVYERVQEPRLTRVLSRDRA